MNVLLPLFLMPVIDPVKPQPGSSRLVDDEQEEGEEMDVTTEDDAAMMAMMGMSGFGSTKVCITVLSVNTLFNATAGQAGYW